jgi:hypothetical protein
MTDPNVATRLAALPDVSGTISGVISMTADVSKFQIPQDDLFERIGKYVTHIETGETKDTCLCEWLEEHNTGLKLQRVEENLECPVHTKEGFLLGFFRWMFPHDEIAGPPAESEPMPRLNPQDPRELVAYQNSGEPITDLSAALKERIRVSQFESHANAKIEELRPTTDDA